VGAMAIGKVSVSHKVGGELEVQWRWVEGSANSLLDQNAAIDSNDPHGSNKPVVKLPAASAWYVQPLSRFRMHVIDHATRPNRQATRGT
jgi:hypothetical protein